MPALFCTYLVGTVVGTLTLASFIGVALQPCGWLDTLVQTLPLDTYASSLQFSPGGTLFLTESSGGLPMQRKCGRLKVTIKGLRLLQMGRPWR
ncbi:MAG: hypothetical protein HC876_06580 [Chloroflexaceae bacterium]|nr:hypothetical protein [Chloroflexaceae bacterium]